MSRIAALTSCEWVANECVEVTSHRLRYQSVCKSIVTFLVLAILWSPFAANAESGRVALVIGNGSYKSMSTLANPQADAKALAETLSHLGFENGRVEPLLDLDLRSMLKAVRAFGERARNARVAIIYFSGHGLQLTQGDGIESYLLPVDADLADARDVPRQALALRELLDEAGHTDGAAVILLDACRTNPAALRVAGVGARGLARSGLAPVAKAPKGVLISYSTSGGDSADDGSGRHSPYTTALLKHLSTPDRDVMQILRQVRSDVMQSTGNKQEPEVVERLDGDVFLGRSPGDVQQEASTTGISRPAAQPGPETPAALSNREFLFWQSIMNSQNRADFEVYLQIYPEGAFAPLAKNRIAVLGSSTRPAPDAADPVILHKDPRSPDRWTGEERHAVRQMLRLMSLYWGTIDDAPADAALWSGYQRYVETAKSDEIDTVSGRNRKDLAETAVRLATLLTRPAYSPRGIAVADVGAPYEKGLAADNPSQGKAREPDEAVFWYGIAGQRLEVDALTRLGLLLVRGQGAVADIDGASLLWWIASTRGDGTAMFNLAVMHQCGIGVVANKAAAKSWYDAAVRHGRAAAKTACSATASRG